jgi:hypothetical protein
MASVLRVATAPRLFFGRVCEWALPVELVLIILVFFCLFQFADFRCNLLPSSTVNPTGVLLGSLKSRLQSMGQLDRASERRLSAPLLVLDLAPSAKLVLALLHV